MRAHSVAFAAFGIGLAMTSVVAAGERTVTAENLNILIRVHNQAAAPDRILHNAMEETSRIFRIAGIRVDWANCLAVLGDTCKETDDPSGFTLVVLNSRYNPSGKVAMGFALPFSANRNHAAVLYPRIQETASGWRIVGVDRILAHAMAHEIAHLILRSISHGGGIMKAHWGVRDSWLMGQGGMVFTKGQASELRTCLAGLITP